MDRLASHYSLPDYEGGSIVNLMESLSIGLNGRRTGYPPLRSLPLERIKAAKRIALVVIDGLGMNLLRQFDSDDREKPQLSTNLVGEMTSVFPPTTASAVTTFMSGLAPQQHGLTGWFMHLREIGTVTAVLPFIPRYAPLQSNAGNMPMNEIIDIPGFSERLDRGIDVLLPNELKNSQYTKLLTSGESRIGYKDIHDFSQNLQRFCRGEKTNPFLYAYWPKLDSLAHVFGPYHHKVENHFALIHETLAPIVELATQTGTLLIITADHGFIENQPEQRVLLSEHPELKSMLTLPLCGEPRAAYAYVRHDCAHAFERYVRSELGDFVDCVPTETLVDAGWYGLGEPHKELKARAGDFVLLMKEQYAIYDSVIGEKPPVLLGVHGGISEAEQRVPLILAGP